MTNIKIRLKKNFFSDLCGCGNNKEKCMRGRFHWRGDEMPEKGTKTLHFNSHLSFPKSMNMFDGYGIPKKNAYDGDVEKW